MKRTRSAAVLLLVQLFSPEEVKKKCEGERQHSSLPVSLSTRAEQRMILLCFLPAPAFLRVIMPSGQRSLPVQFDINKNKLTEGENRRMNCEIFNTFIILADTKPELDSFLSKYLSGVWVFLRTLRQLWFVCPRTFRITPRNHCIVEFTKQRQDDHEFDKKDVGWWLSSLQMSSLWWVSVVYCMQSVPKLETRKNI